MKRIKAASEVCDITGLNLQQALQITREFAALECLSPDHRWTMGDVCEMAEYATAE